MEDLLGKLSRSPETHKGQNGRVAVIGGSKDYTGAPALVSEAALRTGADLVNVMTSEAVRDIVAGYSENLIVSEYMTGYFTHGAVESALELADWADVVAIGPGLSQPEPEAVETFVNECEVPLVIDADAIEPALDADLENAVLTPHAGEATAIDRKYSSVSSFAEKKDAVVVVKGSEDTIYTPGEVHRNVTGHPAMTVGGTGDVLTGVIASLVSQGLSREEAARLGTWINGRAGENAAEKYGNGVVATDLVEEIGRLLADYSSVP